MGDWRDASMEALWNSDAARQIRQTILDDRYCYCAALACPYLAPGGPSLPASSTVQHVLLRRVLSESRTHVPWGPAVVELDLRASALAGHAIDNLRTSNLLRDTTLLVLRVDASTLDNDDVLSAWRQLSLSPMLSLRVAVEIDLEAFTPPTWRKLKSVLNAVHDILLVVAPDFSYPKLAHPGLRFAGQLRRSMKIARLGLRCTLKRSELGALVALLERREALGLDHMEIVASTSRDKSGPDQTDEAFQSQLKCLTTAPWRHDPAVALGPLHALLASIEVNTAWQDWAAALDLDASQQRSIGALVDDLKEKVAQLFDLPPHCGEQSPVAFLQALSRKDLTATDERQAFEQYIETKIAPAGDISYQTARMEMEARCRKQIAAQLSSEQAATFQSLAARSLLDIDTGFDPLGERVHRDSDNGIPFDSWAAQHQLDAKAKEAARAAIHHWRERFTEVMTTVPEGNAESPAALLARLSEVNPVDARAQFIAYAQRTRVPGKAHTLFVAAESAKQACLQELRSIVGAGATRKDLENMLDKLDTGHDPFAAWLAKWRKEHGKSKGTTEPS